MPCPRCGRDNPIDTVFCDECGARVNGACPACRAPNRPGAKFCRVCGQPLLASNAFSAAPRVAPESYTPHDLADRILTSRAALEGERKQVTVLFADLKGSMELLADRDPEEARKILDPVLQHMMDAVHRFEGTVNQVMGDGIMALFGAPLCPRGSRAPGLLRCARDAGAGEAVRGGGRGVPRGPSSRSVSG